MQEVQSQTYNTWILLYWSWTENKEIHYINAYIFQVHFLEEDRTLIQISLTVNPEVLIGNKAASIQVMTWHQRWLTVTWINDDPVHWRIHASSGLNELSSWFSHWLFSLFLYPSSSVSIQSFINSPFYFDEEVVYESNQFFYLHTLQIHTHIHKCSRN